MTNNDFSTIDLEERINFIKSVELPAGEGANNLRLQRMTLANDDPDALVAGSGVLSFLNGLTKQQKQDVLDSVMLAQLGANAKYPDQSTQRDEWFEHYSLILSKCGWTTTGESLRRVTNLQQEFTMDQVALEIIATVVGANGKPIVDMMLAVFAALKETPPALGLFEQQANNESSGNFQILPCIATDDGEVIMIKSCVQFNSTEKVKKILFWTWKENTVELYAAANSTTLNQRLYSQIREQVQKTLAGHASRFIEDINLG